MTKKSIYIIIFFFTILMSSQDLFSKQFKLVIDAGHGGKDYGAIGKNSREKDINLAVALLFGEMVEKKMDNVKVVYTRKKDVYLTLQERADIANSAKGDLFVSIHTNSVAKSNKNRTKINGSATYTLGLHKSDANLEVAMRENSVIALEDDYTTKYEGFDPNSAESYIMFELNQNLHMAQSVDFANYVQNEFVCTAKRKNNGVRQAGFWVLARTSMPAVLVELDFICNPTQEKFMSSKNGQKQFALSLYNALASYLKANNLGEYEKESSKDPVEEVVVKDVEPKKDKVTVVETQNKNSGYVYKIQILTSNKKLSSNSNEFKGLSPVDSYKDKGLYKYTYGEYESEKDALNGLKQIKKKFKQAFIVEFKDGKRVK